MARRARQQRQRDLERDTRAAVQDAAHLLCNNGRVLRVGTPHPLMRSVDPEALALGERLVRLHARWAELGEEPRVYHGDGRATGPVYMILLSSTGYLQACTRTPPYTPLRPSAPPGAETQGLAATV